MSRKCNEGIIEEICKYCEATEVPSTYALWTAIFSVSAVLGRDCSIDQGYFKIYPNQYVILVAKSAVCRKSTAINMATDFLWKVVPKVNILSQKMTTEAMIKALSQANSSVEESVGCFINDEVITLIDKSKLDLISDLTKLYDCKDFEYETRSRGKEEVKNPCLSIYGGTTVKGLVNVIPVQAIGEGFTSRIVFVYRATRERDIDWVVRSPENYERFQNIVHDLTEVARMRGPMELTKEALDTYKKEYHSFLKNPMTNNPYLSGYAGRRHVTLLKTAMAFSASRCNEREITKQDVWRAIQSLQNAEAKMDIVMRAITSEPVGNIYEHVMAIIVEAGTILRSHLIRETSHRMSWRQLDEALGGLVQTEYVEQIKVDGKIAYKYIKKEEK
jgi:hypothetical protein